MSDDTKRKLVEAMDAAHLNDSDLEEASGGLARPCEAGCYTACQPGCQTGRQTGAATK